MWSLECKHQMLTDDTRHTTHDNGQPLTTIAHHEHFVLRWAKKGYRRYEVDTKCYGRTDGRALQIKLIYIKNYVFNTKT